MSRLRSVASRLTSSVWWKFGIFLDVTHLQSAELMMGTKTQGCLKEMREKQPVIQPNP